MEQEVRHKWNNYVIVGAPMLAVVLGFGVELVPDNPAANHTAAVAFLMAAWWITGAIPLAATALLPVVCFPLLGVMPAGTVAAQFMNDTIFLFLGGFMVALAMQHWDLHRRIALRLLLFFGVRPAAMLLGFMVPTFLLSMWISNTATTMMMTPIALSVIYKMEEQRSSPQMGRYTIGLLLGIAYSASIGGISTLIGTPPNLSFSRIFAITFPDAPEIDFVTWFIFALPLALVLLLVLWAMLAVWFTPKHGELAIDRSVIEAQYRAMGKTTYEQWVILAVFVTMALCWLFRSDIVVGPLSLPGWSGLLSEPAFARDGTVAVFMALLLFLVPSRSTPRRAILTWENAKDLPWDILLLFGGGFALAKAFADSGLAMWVGEQLSGLQSFSPLIMVVIICLCVSFLTELTSNAATTEMLLPIMASLAVAIQIHPLFIMVPVTVTCSCAFMLPVATPPNAIVFASNRLRVADMARAGIALNLIAVVLVTLFMMIWGTRIFDIDLNQMPDWAHL